MENQIKIDRDFFLSNLFFHKYKPIKKIGEGSFGMIYMAENIVTGELFALKFEDKNSGQCLLESEAYVMSYLRGKGIPLVKSYGYSGDYNILVMELLGKSLEDILISRQEKKFSVRTVCMLAEQMITILESIHSKHIIHRDIKPDNFVMGVGENERTLYLLDFGLARKFRSSTTFQHYPMRNRKKLTGTARYASINALRGIEQSRRDDLEAVGYVIMYFLRGNLPWQGLPVKTKEDRYRKIMEKKQMTHPEELCKGFPYEFTEYVAYSRNLQYDQDPDYEYLKSLFRNYMSKNNFPFDYNYDWYINEETPTTIVKETTESNKSFTNQINSLNVNNTSNHPISIPKFTTHLQNFNTINSKFAISDVINEKSNYTPKLTLAPNFTNTHEALSKNYFEKENNIETSNSGMNTMPNFNPNIKTTIKIDEDEMGKINNTNFNKTKEEIQNKNCNLNKYKKDNKCCIL